MGFRLKMPKFSRPNFKQPWNTVTPFGASPLGQKQFGDLNGMLGALGQRRMSIQNPADPYPESAYDPGMQVLGMQNGSKGGSSLLQGMGGEGKMAGQSALGGFGGMAPRAQSANPMQSAVRRMRVFSKGGF